MCLFVHLAIRNVRKQKSSLSLPDCVCVCVYVCCYCCIEQAQKQNKTNQSTCNKINYECLAHFWFFFLSHSHIRTHYTVWIRMIQKMFWIFSLELLHSEQLFLAVHLSWKWPNSSSVTSFFWCILSFHRQLFTEFTVKIFLGHATAQQTHQYAISFLSPRAFRPNPRFRQAKPSCS